MERISFAFISFTACLGIRLADDLRLAGQLVAGKAQSLARGLLGDARDLEHDPARLDYRNPVLGRTLTGTHTGLSGLRSDRLVGEYLYPDLAAALKGCALAYSCGEFFTLQENNFL